jgi:hypothetical protein
MEIKRKTEVFVRTKRRFVIHQSDAAEQMFCPICGELMLTAETAAAMFGINRRTIYQMIENGAVHFAETADGIVMICLSSLAAGLDGDPKQLPEAKTGEF